jgi:GMP synthase-like glutamine amidotransferase
MILVIKNIDVEGLGYIEEIFVKNVVPFRYQDSKELSKDLGSDKFDGLIVLGGPQSVYEYDKYGYLDSVKGIISKFIENDKPVLGICLGAQLIADLLGARVYKGASGEEIGWYNVSLTRDAWRDGIFSKFAPTFKVFQWHGDTFDLPKDAIRIATSDNYLNQAFRYKSNVYALQFHVEVRGEDFVRWSRFYKLEDSKTNGILEGFREYGDEMRKMCNELVWKLFIHHEV